MNVSMLSVLQQLVVADYDVELVKINNRALRSFAFRTFTAACCVFTAVN